MKKLINDPRRVVREMLEGIVDTTPGLALLDNEDVVIRSDLPTPADRQVAVISGGGAGHEPAHAGYVGHGMLHAAVVGDVFTSPSVDAVLAAIQAVGGPRGVVLIVKNYTGDRLNFGLAAELARAAGIPTEVVVVADDVALRNTVEPARRRGIAGTVLVHKITGALAASGASLGDVADAARAAAASIGTMGVALGGCTVPAAGTPGFHLAEDEIELGLGIHGEQGVMRQTHQTADALAETILDVILTDRAIGAESRVAVLVNGLGGTPPMELALVARAALATLRARGVIVERLWTGTFLSALEMPGFSLSVMPIDNADLVLLDALTEARAWLGDGRISRVRDLRAVSAAAQQAAERNRSADECGPLVRDMVLACAKALEASERRLTELDSAAGDGDLGISMARGARALHALLQDGGPADAGSMLSEIAGALRRAIAGSSGPFYVVGLLRAARHVAGAATLDANAWATAFERGVQGIAELGGAKLGDRTMLDALGPAVAALKRGLAQGKAPPAAWADCMHAAEMGTKATAQMSPRLGRASYLGARALGGRGCRGRCRHGVACGHRRHARPTIGGIRRRVLRPRLRAARGRRSRLQRLLGTLV